MASQRFNPDDFASKETTPGLDRPLSPDECEAFAKSLHDLPAEYQLSPTEIEMLQEGMHGALAYGEPTRAATAMKARLAYLLGEKAKALDTMEDCEESLFKQLSSDIQDLNRQITETRTRLDDYLRQQGNAN